MPTRYLQVVFSDPAQDVYPQWEKYTKEYLLATLPAGNQGALYDIVPNPMGRPPPDDSTSLVLLESEEHLYLHSRDMREVTHLSSSSVDSRSYELIESFDPLELGVLGADRLIDTPGPFILQAEAEPADIGEYIEFYRDDHAPMMAKHAGYLRTTLYRLKDVQEGQVNVPAPLMIIHEFRHLEGLGSQITKDSVETEFAKRVFPRVRSMKARMMKLVFAHGR
ncbi:hypothetical protein FE257_012999 [Aspergillus nanangensis]|uniref:EthD domain-containing protein n=1 Tax=Aspergillus nanangensis TaxID=2582783 RepID=A0AAD4CF57_ASPNN|nr:hypothetical protein FE257_012999 [Aspergillus nanangensis]